MVYYIFLTPNISSDTGALAAVSVINDDDEAKNGRKKKASCRIFQKGDCSLLSVLVGIASFCLAYYFTRDERFVIERVQQ